MPTDLDRTKHLKLLMFVQSFCLFTQFIPRNQKRNSELTLLTRRVSAKITKSTRNKDWEICLKVALNSRTQ